MIRYILFFVLLISVKLNAQYSDFTNSFQPTPGKYVVSGWIKEIHPTQQLTYTGSIKISLTNTSAPLMATLHPVGEIIDGWQLIAGEVTIAFLEPATVPKLEIELVCSNTATECYFDDIRFHPYNGSMKSFVYDEQTQRLMAELDENNYATFYEYDLEGGLIRVKKETEKGVFTIQETRSNSIKQN
ncbi:hypothetical protein E6C50_13235 [Flavobacterium supellecticarium]|uniref:Uncharacterized protein n=1 Tax=Flavobacterium supellecticarium TaxID=2565924 RepID=A0A4S3ZU13_9FLAO|nr:hypothetical protein [Flavobacterium supellecticarium]THF49199.1 hypothetical protein E6C50_13235 [Flavobacterium supellecticarium]